jgi:DNA (cytosine-5)-methyltransferase 1
MLRIVEEAKPAWVVGENVVGIITMELDQVCADLEAVGYEVWPLVIPACGVDAPHRRDRVWILANSKHDGFSFAPNRGCVATPTSEQPSWTNHSFNPSGTGEVSSTQPNVADFNLKRQGWDQRIGTTRKKELPGRHASQCSSSCGKPDVAHPKGGEPRGIQDKVGSEGSQVSNELFGIKGGLSGELCFKNVSYTVWLPEPRLGRLANGIPNRVAKLRGLGNAIVPQVAYQILEGIKRCI